MEYYGKFVHTLVRIQQISLMIRLDLCYENWRLVTQNISPTFPGFRGTKCCVQCIDSHPHKPIFYPCNYYDGSNVIKLT